MTDEEWIAKIMNGLEKKYGVDCCINPHLSVNDSSCWIDYDARSCKVVKVSLSVGTRQENAQGPDEAPMDILHTFVHEMLHAIAYKKNIHMNKKHGGYNTLAYATEEVMNEMCTDAVLHGMGKSDSSFSLWYIDRWWQRAFCGAALLDKRVFGLAKKRTELAATLLKVNRKKVEKRLRFTYATLKGRANVGSENVVGSAP